MQGDPAVLLLGVSPREADGSCICIHKETCINMSCGIICGIGSLDPILTSLTEGWTSGPEGGRMMKQCYEMYHDMGGKKKIGKSEPDSHLCTL